MKRSRSLAYKEGSLVTGKVLLPKNEKLPKTSFYNVKIGVNLTAKLCITQITEKDDFSSFRPKAAFNKCRILKTNPLNQSTIYVSIRPSLVNGDISIEEEFQDFENRPKIGDVVQGFVEEGSTKFGVFVRINRFCTALVEKRLLSSKFINDISKAFPPGKVVKGVITQVDEEKNKYYMSLLKRDIAKYSNDVDLVKFENLKQGQSYSGSVVSCKPYGVFVELDNSLDIRGLCHRSEISDEELISDASNLFERGDKVVVKVVEVDNETKKVSFGLKPSYFTPEELEKFANLAEEEEESDEEEEEEQEEVEEEEEKENEADQIITLEELMASEVESKPKKQKLEKSEPPRVKKIIKLADHSEQDREDFEEQLLAKPNDSLIWIKCITSHLVAGSFKKVKETFDKAFETIDPRHEGEKWNIWHSFVKILLEYSKETELAEAISLGLSVFDKKKVHSALAQLYKEANRFEDSDNSLVEANRMAKFADEQLWFERIKLRFDMKQADLIEEAREKILKQALKKVSSKNEPSLVLNVARLEFDKKSNDFALPDRGETLCQSLLSKHPKRSDLWHQVIDIEVKFRNLAEEDEVLTIRRLFERVVTLEFKVKVMRTFFKKWLKFEKKVGSKEQQDAVKARAKEYVKRMLRANEGEE